MTSTLMADPISHIKHLVGPWDSCANPHTDVAASGQSLAAGSAVSGSFPGIVCSSVSVPLPFRLLRLYPVPSRSLRVTLAVNAR